MEDQAENGSRSVVPMVALAAGVLVAVIWFAVPERRIADSLEGGAPQGAMTASEAAAANASASARSGSAPDASLASADPGAEPEGFEASRGQLPSFDIVRVAPDGGALIAGTAEPRATVTIYADEKPLAATTADADGSFVAMFDAEPSGQPQALTIGARTEDGASLASDEVVMLFPGGSDTGGPDADADEGGAPEVAATAILRPDAVEVTPVADEGPAVSADQVSLGSISYSEAGEIELSGVGPSGRPLRAYVDNQLVQEGEIRESGRWVLRLADISEGLYQLRIDQLAEDGSVGSRVETPFQRDYPAGPRPRPGSTGEGMLPGVLVTVQPGGTLWTLARSHYGSGAYFSQIFTANREMIRDPDLIYPGQVLAIPTLQDTSL